LLIIQQFRLPVPSLWLDVFQKIKALGYNTVSFYTHWALLEGTPGTFSAEGVFGFEKFFAAASQAGIYLIARPGPYINAEVSGGGFPGWLQRVPGTLRTKDKSYLDATELYMAEIGKLIADAQITNGGPVVLVQPENEYTSFTSDEEPDQEYFIYVEEQLRRAGIVVPLINNEAAARGYVTPTTEADIDIYGFDGYPLGELLLGFSWRAMDDELTIFFSF
jgi:beta-galactosidase GanA